GGGGAGARDRPLQAPPRRAGDGHRRPPPRGPAVPGLGAGGAPGSLRGLRAAGPAGVRGPRFLGAAAGAGRAGPQRPPPRALAPERAPGRRLRRRDHRLGRGAGARLEAPVCRCPLEPHAASALRPPAPLPPAGARAPARAPVRSRLRGESPGDSVLETVVAPEHLVAHEEGRRAEDAPRSSSMTTAGSAMSRSSAKLAW